MGTLAPVSTHVAAARPMWPSPGPSKSSKTPKLQCSGCPMALETFRNFDFFPTLPTTPGIGEGHHLGTMWVQSHTHTATGSSHSSGEALMPQTPSRPLPLYSSQDTQIGRSVMIAWRRILLTHPPPPLGAGSYSVTPPWRWILLSHPPMALDPTQSPPHGAGSYSVRLSWRWILLSHPPMALDPTQSPPPPMALDPTQSPPYGAGSYSVTPPWRWILLSHPPMALGPTQSPPHGAGSYSVTPPPPLSPNNKQ